MSDKRGNWYCYACKKNTTFGLSTAYKDTLVATEDFGGDAHCRGATQSRIGPAKLVSVWKCEGCGRSWEAGHIDNENYNFNENKNDNQYNKE